MRRPSLLTCSARVAAESAQVRADLLARGYLAPAQQELKKAKTPSYAGPGSSVHNPNEGGSNHGISKL